MASDLVTYEDFVRITGDDQTPNDAVEAAINEMLSLIEEEIDRTLLNGTYTETLPLSETGYVFPRAVPVTSTPASASYQSWDQGFSLRGAAVDVFAAGPFPDITEILEWRSGGNYSTVTYQGGFTYATFPPKLRRMVCRLALATLNPTTALLPGTTAASVGDTSVSFESGTVSAGELDALIPGTCRALDGFRRPVY